MSITKSLAKRITNYDDVNSIGSKLRAKRLAPLLKIIHAIHDKRGCVNIIDVGGTEEYWNIAPLKVLEELNVTLTIVNIPDIKLPDDHGLFTFVHGDGCDLSMFKTHSFDIAHSNSVIEHVGDWGRMVQFSDELKRVAKIYFVQTPNYWFPIEPHCMTPFFHLLPKSIQIWMVMHFALGHWEKAESIDEAVRTVNSVRLLDNRMFCELFNDAYIATERFFFLPKSHLAIRDVRIN